jgi:aspartyl-tRNA(Asn)/glutamyl-tRNA(Gln) amidotransferase subunit A
VTTDWTNASLCGTADAIRAGTLTARDLAEAMLHKIEMLDPAVAAFVEVDADGYRKAADKADSDARSGVALGPLHGVPLAHKDMYYRSGRPSACGSRLDAATPREITATVLTKLDAAGALETGRLVMVEYAMGPHGYNANYPQCRNPWNLAHIPRGSSSGSGVAVAARLAHGSLGSDTGGSIRTPAAANGVVGLVPTNGRVSRHGVMPMSFSLDAVGPLTRTVRDAARLLDVIAGYDPDDGTSFDVPSGGFEQALSDAAPRPKIGLARGYFDEQVHPDIAAGLAAAANTFVVAGYSVEPVDLPVDLLHEVADLHPLVMKAEGAANHMVQLRHRQAEYTFEVSQRLHAGHFIPAADYIQALKLRGAYLKAFAAQAFKSVDVLLTPALSIPVPTIAETTGKTAKDYLDMVLALTRNTKVVNYLGLPAMSVPCGFDRAGLPLAFQLLARPFDETSLLRVGNDYQSRTDWHQCLPEIVRGTPY